MRTLRAGAIIGFGNVAANGHVPGWADAEGFRIVAVADPDPRRRQLAGERLGGVRLYASADSLLEAEAVDFVDIATPPAWHAPAVCAAAARGAHVLCEKPLTTRLDDYRRMRAAADAAGVALHTVHNWKHAEAFRLADEWVRAGALGRLQTMVFEAERDGCSAATGENWRIRAAVAGGGILVDHGWHAFYLAMALAGERPCRVRAQLQRRRFTDAEVEDTAHCEIKFPSCVAELRLTWAATERRTRWQLVGTDGRLVIDEDQMILESRVGRQVRHLSSSLSAGSHHPEWFTGVLRSFQAAIDDPSARSANSTEAELCVLLLHLAYASDAAGGCPLDVPGSLPALEEKQPARDNRSDLTAHGG